MSFRKKNIQELTRPPAATKDRDPRVAVSVICEDIRSAQNIGSIFRTCDAFGIHTLYLCGISAHPPHKGIQKTAIGASLTVDWKYCESVEQCLTILRKQHDNLHLLAVEQTTSSTDLLDWSVHEEAHIAIVLGNEVSGVTDPTLDLVDEVVEIAQYGQKHSLNVSVAAGIVLHLVTSRVRTRSAQSV